MLHYTELHWRLKGSGFDCNIFDSEKSPQPRIYLNGYGDHITAYLFVDETRKQNDYSNPLTGYGLAVFYDKKTDTEKTRLLRRLSVKHQIMVDLYHRGITGLCPVADWKAVGL